MNRIHFFFTNQTLTDPSCHGFSDGSIEIEVEGGSEPYTFDWDGSEMNTNNPTGLSAGIYQVIVSDLNDCSLTDSFTLNAPAEPGIIVEAQPDAIVQYETTELIVTNVTGLNEPLSYSWEPSILIDCQECPSTIASPMVDTTFTVVVSDENGCEVTGKVFISVEELLTNYFVPNAFSPNGDGENDEFKVYGNGIKGLTMRVFDRWGALVFESMEVDARWDGTYKGRDLPEGVYIYTVTVIFEDGKMEQSNGSVTIIR